MTVDVAKRVAGKRVSAPHLKRMARRILSLLDHKGAELSLALVGNDEIRELNRRYRNRPKPTDVLSFPAGEPLGGPSRLLGDVVISVEQAEKQSKRGGRRLEEEIDRLLIHGILHLLGYDHERSRREARIMRGMERKISGALCEKKGLKV